MVIDRLSRWVLKLVAALMLFAGVSALVASVFLLSLPADIPALRMIAGTIVEIAGLFVVAGGVATFLSRSRRPLLPNEQMPPSGDERPVVGGWLILLAVALIALPLGLLVGLRGFIAGWRELTAFLDTINVWEGANANMSGVVLVPLAGALAPALLIWAATAMFILASAILLWLLSTRAPAFPRTFFAWGVLLAALVIACVRSADAVTAAGQALQPYLAVEPGAVDEIAALRESITRYAAIVGSAALVLVWALLAFLMWLPAILFSRRARTTFAPTAHNPDIESATRYPRTGL